MAYLVVMTICRGSLVELKGLLQETVLPLPLTLRVVRAVHGTVALVPTSTDSVLVTDWYMVL